MDQEKLREIQIDLEQECRGLGIERYRRERQRDESTTPPGRALLRKTATLLQPVYTKWLDEAAAGKASKSAHTVAFLQSFDADMVTLVTATACIQFMVGKGTLQDVALHIAVQLEDQLNHEALRAEDPRMHRRLMTAIGKSGSQHYRHVVLRKYVSHAKIVAIKWNDEVRLRIGTLLVELFCSATGAAEVKSIPRIIRGKMGTVNMLIPSEEAGAWLDKAHAFEELLSPQFLPMVVEPKPWTNPRNGGYLSKHMRQPLIKTNNSRYLEELHHVRMPDVYRSLNAVQSTPWAINSAVYEVMNAVWDAAGTLGGLPSRDALPLPAKTFGDDPSPEALKAWKKQASAVHEENHLLRSKRFATAQKLGLAKRMSEFDRFYFVHNLDWRGRAYALASFLNPQGDDAAKGLLRFADGCALGDGGAFWLAVHGANCYGVDKVTFDERVQWVLQNQDAILASAIDPLENTFWAQTDDNPWQFLAFCKEWAGLVLFTQAGGKQEDYVSYLAVGLDGTCNGLQNFSMALRDEVGGAATNLVPSDRPADIYSKVALAAATIVQRDAQMGDPVAKLWVGKVSRKMAKRPTMTMPYGSSAFGFKDQIMETLAEVKRKTGELIIEDPKDRFPAALYLSKVLDTAISQVVVKAREAMDWLQDVATLAAADGLPVRWTSPSGLPVVQSYKAPFGNRLDFTVAGRRYALWLRVDGTELDKRKQRTGIAPNYVHSLDAAHLVRSVTYCVDKGLRHFAMIHDSFGTHAGNVDALSYELRRAFVDQYSGDVLARFRQEIVDQLTDQKLRDKVPPVPGFGTLDPTAVMQSQYFFA